MRKCSVIIGNAPEVVQRTVPAYATAYSHRGWKIHQIIDRVYVKEKARKDQGWEPTYDFAYVVARINAGESLRSPLTQLTGSKGYHAEIASIPSANQ
ncbi:hypothetical protein [Chitinophaga eiseniae]|uniref:Uncharacterized protein n=1 Tax=Chitinophaga eiseniae TaxID=634771 RepID=A0A847SK68_9BACT|nr:hypothetical protein [Chitinophaga eiseniae]NLR82291.1 hypothetical protein [Chitinophaga eiseniae]